MVLKNKHKKILSLIILLAFVIGLTFYDNLNKKSVDLAPAGSTLPPNLQVISPSSAKLDKAICGGVDQATGCIDRIVKCVAIVPEIIKGECGGGPTSTSRREYNTMIDRLTNSLKKDPATKAACVVGGSTAQGQANEHFMTCKQPLPPPSVCVNRGSADDTNIKCTQYFENGVPKAYSLELSYECGVRCKAALLEEQQ